MKRGAKVGLAFVGGALALAALSKGGGVSQVPHVVGVAGGSPVKPPAPVQGDGFRSGPQPDPAAPNDPNRGRVFWYLGHSLEGGNTSEHPIDVFGVAPDANGQCVVDVWANRDGMPQRCAAYRYRLVVKDGRLQKAELLVGVAGIKCPPGSESLLKGVPAKGPKIAWEQRGPDLYLLWSVSTTGDGLESQAVGFLVDIFWRWVNA